MMGKQRQVGEEVKDLGEQRLTSALFADKHSEGAERHSAGLYWAKRPADNSKRIDGFATHKSAILQLHDDRARTRVGLFTIYGQSSCERGFLELPV